MSDTFRCEACQGVFPKAWSDEEAQAERVASGFGDIPDADMAVICEDCYNLITQLQGGSHA